MNDDLHKHSHTIYDELIDNNKDSEYHVFTDNQCSHRYWIKRCSLCNVIIESDSRDSTDNIIDVECSELESLVCSFNASRQLQKLKIRQSSLMYWVYYPDLNVRAIRLKNNVVMKNTHVTSAFNLAELVHIIVANKLSVSDDEVFTHAQNPTKIAALIIKELKKKRAS